MSDQPDEIYINPSKVPYGNSLAFDGQCMIKTGRKGEMTNYIDGDMPIDSRLQKNHSCFCPSTYGDEISNPYFGSKYPCSGGNNLQYKHSLNWANSCKSGSNTGSGSDGANAWSDIPAGRMTKYPDGLTNAEVRSKLFRIDEPFWFSNSTIGGNECSSVTMEFDPSHIGYVEAEFGGGSLWPAQRAFNVGDLQREGNKRSEAKLRTVGELLSPTRNARVYLIPTDAEWVQGFSPKESTAIGAQNGPGITNGQPGCNMNFYPGWGSWQACFGSFSNAVRIDNLPIKPGSLYDTNDHYYSSWKDHDSLKNGVNISRTSCTYTTKYDGPNDCSWGYMPAITGTGLVGKVHSTGIPDGIEQWENYRMREVSIRNYRIIIPEDWKTKYPQGFHKIQLWTGRWSTSQGFGEIFKHIDLRGEAI